MLNFNAEVEKLKERFEEERDMYEKDGNKFEMWAKEGSIRVCDMVLNTQHETTLEVMYFIKIIELEAINQILEVRNTKRLCYHEGREEAIAPLREIAERTLS